MKKGKDKYFIAFYDIRNSDGSIKWVWNAFLYLDTLDETNIEEIELNLIEIADLEERPVISNFFKVNN